MFGHTGPGRIRTRYPPRTRQRCVTVSEGKFVTEYVRVTKYACLLVNMRVCYCICVPVTKYTFGTEYACLLQIMHVYCSMGVYVTE